MLGLGSFWQSSQAFLAWLPDWLAGCLILLAAAVAALVIHLVLLSVLRRILGARHLFLGALLVRTRTATRLGLVVLLLTGALEATAFPPTVHDAIAHALYIGFIVLLGWFALIAVHLAAETYLRRFQTDSTDALLARKHITQVRILRRAVDALILVVTIGAALMTFGPVRQYGVSLFASAGVLGLAVGLAARPVLGNLIAGVQIAVTQPIRLEDAVIVENEFGWIEEIASSYVVVRVWDQRRLIIPLSYFIEKPFQNWTRQNPQLLGTVDLHLDYAAPVERIREKLGEIVSRSPLWDRRVANLQVADATQATILVRAVVSAKDAGALGDLRNEVREKLLAFLRDEHPGALPRHRGDLVVREVSSENGPAPPGGAGAATDNKRLAES